VTIIFLRPSLRMIPAGVLAGRIEPMAWKMLRCSSDRSGRMPKC
jgi:hypothetical protein